MDVQQLIDWAYKKKEEALKEKRYQDANNYQEILEHWERHHAKQQRI
jgi:hypothetical protein